MISYLSDRKQKIKLKKFLSDSFSLTYDVLQGTCLGAVIFIAYVTYLYEVTDNFIN